MTSINSLVDRDPLTDTETPTTPKAGHFAQQMSDRPDEHPDMHRLSSATAHHHATGSSNASPRDDEDAMDLDDEESDGEDDGGDDSSRKKKGQRFFCTNFPPCNLSFTRSEHLARHIRKHTGERPFQCHCNRRFSRLDNLRQHAQTVHVNEEIPGDSLAATGTRFQRQIRTDRVRQGPRPRSGTMGSAGGHSRGHSRNLSASSIGSTSSNYSTVTEAKRRPPPLLMANDSSRAKLSMDDPSTPPHGYYNAPHSPGGFSTPTSATFSAAPGSPSYPPTFASPVSSHSRAGSFDRTAQRRLSVPSGFNPYQNVYGGSPYTPPSHSSTQGSVYGSPTTANFPGGPSYYQPMDDPRRRTWHPSTYTGANYNYGRPATSGLLYSQTPDAPQPAYAQHATVAAGQGPRLPGIETLYDAQERRDRGLSPPRRQPSPQHPGQPPYQSSEYPPLDDHGNVARPGTWGQQTIDELRRVGAPQGYAPHHDMGPPPQQPQHMAQEALQVSGKQVKRQNWHGPHHRTSPEDSSSSEGIPTPGTSTVEVHPIIMPSSGFIEPQTQHMLPHDGQQQVYYQSEVHAELTDHDQACLDPAARMTSPYVDHTRERTTSLGERSTGGDMNRLEALVAVATRDESPR